MHIVRVIYLYVISAVSLWVLVAGLAGLLALALRGLGMSDDARVIVGQPETVLEDLSRSLALAAVGLPLWTIHWWLVERTAANEMTEHEQVFRALYLGGVLLLTTVVALTSTVDVVSRLLAAALGAERGGGAGSAESVAWMSVAAATWAYHATLLLRDGVLARRFGRRQSGGGA